MNEDIRLFDEHLIALMSAAAIGIITSLIAWSLGFYVLKPAEKLQNGSIHRWHVLGAFFMFLSVELVIVPSCYFIWIYFTEGKFPEGHFETTVLTQGWLNVFAILCSAVAIFTFCLMQDKSVRAALWGSGSSFKSSSIVNFLFGSLSWLVVYPWIGVVSQLAAIALSFFYHGPHVDQIAVKHLKKIMDHFELFWITALAITIIVPILEEILFRGFLQTWLKGILGRFQAIILTSLIFAFFHFSRSQGFDNFELMISLFCLSCFLGFVRERQNSLWASIGLHSTFNGVSIIFLALE